MIVGIDISSYDAVLVGLPYPRRALADQPVVETVVFRPRSRPGEDEAFAAMKTVRSALLQSKLFHEADVFWVERGFGASRKADFLLGAFFGLILAACAGAATTNPMEAREWKREISASCGVTTKAGKAGNANLTKDAAHVYVRQVATKLGHDVAGFNGDQLDAYAIAVVGRWLNERSEGNIIP